jgi:ABC-type multidrug transport system permease subunit
MAPPARRHPSNEASKQANRQTGEPVDHPPLKGIALIFTALAYGIVAILLVFQMLMRLALIDSSTPLRAGMLILLSPVAALLWVLPQTQGWFRWWADLFPITVFQQAIRHGADGRAHARQPVQLPC